jgi:butyryl-CoA dehydrogenase
VDLRLSEEQVQLRGLARRLAEREFVPHVERWDRDHEFLDHGQVAALASAGLLGLTLPPELGGGGRPVLDALLVIEELARVSCVCAFPVFESSVGPIHAVDAFGTLEQRSRFIPEVAAGRHWMAVGITEPEAGSAATDMRTRAVLKDDRYVVNGTKAFVSGGGVADSYLVYLRLDEHPGANGIGALIVERGTPGLAYGKAERYMGTHGIPAAELVFTDCEVPVGNLVVPAGGFRRLMTAFDVERLGNATIALGIARAALELSVAYAQERRQFGRSIGEFQAVQFLLADMAISVDAARLLIHRAAAEVDAGGGVAAHASMAKTFSVETATRVTDQALEIFGGYGYSQEGPIERLVRDARGWKIAGGTVQMQRITIASALLGRRLPQRLPRAASEAGPAPVDALS